MIEKIKKETLIGFFKTLKTVYAVKAAIRSMAQSGSLRGLKGLYYGSEAVSTAICAVLSERDKLVNTCDGIENLIARGGDLKNIFAEIFGGAEGYNNGIRGPINISIPEKGIYSANSLSDTQVAMGNGFAMAAKIRGEKVVVASFYKDITSNEGIIHESMNIASAFNLPVLFICNTDPGIKGKELDDLIKKGRFSSRSIGYGIEGYPVDGTDVVSVYLLADRLIEKIRQDNRPAIIECLTNTYYESLKNIENDENIENISTEKKSIITGIMGNFERQLLNKGIMTAEEAKSIEEDMQKTVSEAIEFGKNNIKPDHTQLNDFMYADKSKGIPKAGWTL